MTAAPLISCLMVTRDRVRFAARAVRCLAAQTWPSVELVVVDDGDHDYEPVLAPFRARFPIRYLRVCAEPGRKLGGLRNLALDAARGELCAQWDDDEWYHPERLAVQARAILDGGADASVLKWTLMHVDTPAMASLPYRADAGQGTPGTVVHRRTRVRYPNLARSEDARFLEALAARGRVAVLGAEHSHLFIRCYHGGNTWDAAHFHRRLRRTPLAAAHYLVARLRGDLRSHPQLVLTAAEQAAVAAFLADSRALSLLRAA
ncbi:MAG: glycosyltransferase family 2 protein [Kofleriaceae bacterium]|nr:glycosyltransferase family 2 protein [Myxococcales bacterium]MCB9560857.1 glycosyltransferase family 2 protein [Kofleriaceae bacterium]